MHKSLFFISILFLLFEATTSSANGMKGNLEANEINFISDTFYPILIRANICSSAHKDCKGGDYIICSSTNALTCNVYRVTDKKVIEEIRLAILNSGLNFSSFTFWPKPYHHNSIFTKPILKVSRVK